MAPATVFLFLGDGLPRAAVIAALIAAVATARGALQRSLVVRNEALLYRRVVEAALSGDVLEASLLPDQEARDTLFEGMHRVATVLAETVPNLIANSLAAVILVSGILATQRPRTFILAGIALLVAGAVLFLTRGAAATSQVRAWASWDSMAQYIGDACEGRLEIVASGNDAGFATRFGSIARDWERRARIAARVAGLMGRLPVALLATSVAALVVVDAWRSGASWSTAAARAAVLAACAPAFLGIAACLQQLVANEQRLVLAERVIFAPRCISTGTVPVSVPTSIEFRRVHFVYAGEVREALSGLSFVWRAGELLALSGPNGAGKTTCMRTLLGLAKPTAGEVLVDGIPLERLDLERWRSMIGFLPQRPYLPARQTIRECLRFLDPAVGENAMHDAVDRVGLTQRLHLTPSRILDLRLGHLSTGERQRVPLARLLCRSTPIVMLDEPDANLDRDGLQLVAQVLAEMKRERMVLLVAHTAEVLGVADRVITLGAGAKGTELDQAKARSAQLQ